MKEKTKRLIRALYNIDEAYFANEYKKQLSGAELSLMHALDEGGSYSQKEIAAEWLIPKTTINTITKRWEKEGLLIQTPIPGKRREMRLTLTDAGKEYAKSFLSFIYEAEEKALRETLERHSDEFIEAIEFFGERLKAAFEERQKEQRDNGTGLN